MLTALDLGIVAVYLVFLLGLGLFLRHKANRGVSHYFLSGRSLPWWVAGTSMAASAFSADTPLYVTDITRAGGIGANWEWWCYAIGGGFSVYFLARLWRRAGVLTDVELTELRYDGRGARWLRALRALIMSVPVNCIAMALVIKAMTTILSDSLGVDPAWLIPVCLAVTLLYSLLSGFWGVVVTDFIQFILAFAGALILAGAAVAAVGGLDSLATEMHALPPERSPLNLLPRGGDGFWSSLPAALALLFGVQWWAFINADGGGKIIQRQLACRDEREAVRATMWFTVTHYVLRTWPWIVVALASLVLLPDLAEGTRAYTAVMLEVLPSGWRGFMVATFLAAFMSTIDTQLNWGSSYFVHDFYARFVRPASSERHLLKLSRLTGIAALVLAGVFTYFSDSVTSIFRFLLAMGAGVGPIYLLRWFWWRVNAWTELVAMLASMGVATACRWAGLPLAPSLLITLAVSLPLALAATFLTRPVSEEHLRRFVMRTRPFGAWSRFRSADTIPDPLWPAIGGWLAFTAALFLLLFGTGWLILGPTGWGVAALAAALPLGYWALRTAES